jgi:prepilin-type processing-associated H-X9-DG protein
MVDMKAGDFSLKDILKDLSAQSGYTIETWPNLQDRPVQLKAGRMPVIMALELIGRQAGCTLQQGFGDDRLRLGQGQPPEHSWFDGAFRVSATNVQQFRNIDLNQALGTATRRTDSMTLGLNLNSEPRLPLLGVGEPRLSLAIDNLDQSLLGPMPGEPGWTGGATRHISRYGNGYRSQSQGFSAAMRRVSERSTHIKLIRGSVSCVVLVDQKPVPLTQDILKAKGQTAVVGTTSFTIDLCDANGVVPPKDAIADVVNTYTKPFGVTNQNEAFSFHTGGINACFADGSVKFVKDSINGKTFASIISRSGGELYSID